MFGDAELKKIKSTKTHTVFQHPDGHEIHIAHDALEQDEKDHLDSIPHFADGGDVPPIDIAPKTPELENVTNPVMAPIGGYPEQTKYKDIYAQKLAEFPSVTDPEARKFAEQQALDAASKAQNEDILAKQQADQLQQQQYQQEQLKSQLLGNQMPSVPGSSQDFDQKQAMAQMTQPQAANPNDPYSNMLGNMQADYGQILKGLQSQQAIAGKSAQELSDIYSQNQAQQQQAAADYAARRKVLEDRTNQLMQDVQNGKVDPNHYWSNQTTGQKVGNIIGLFLGGLGAGFTGKSNVVADLLQKEQDRDIEAQKIDMGKKQNLLGENFRALGDMDQAERMTRAMQNDAYISQLQAARAKAEGPQQQAALDQAIGQLKLQKDQALGQVAFRVQAMQNEPGSVANKALQIQSNPLFNDKFKEKALGELEESAKAASLRDFALDQYNQLNSLWARGALSPNMRSAAVNAIAGRMQHLFEGRFNTEAAQKLADSTLPQITDFAKETQQFKLHNLMKEFDSSTPILDGMHVVAPHKEDLALKFPPQTQKLIALARQHPENPKAKIFLNKLGLPQ